MCLLLTVNFNPAILMIGFCIKEMMKHETPKFTVLITSQFKGKP